MPFKQKKYEIIAVEGGQDSDLNVSLGSWSGEFQVCQGIIRWIRNLNNKAFRNMERNLNSPELRQTKHLIQPRQIQRTRDNDTDKYRVIRKSYNTSKEE